MPKKYTKIPAISGLTLMKLLQKDGWKVGRKVRHGISLTKLKNGKTKVTFIPLNRETIPDGTLSDILGPQQTGLGKKGLLELINKYGL